MVASEYEKSREKENLKRVLKSIKDKTGNQIKVFTTDGLTADINVVKKTFGYNNQTRKYNINHNIVNASQGECFNHPIERLNNTIRQRTQNFRGLHGSVNSANALFKGIQIFYNFIRKHEALKNKTPYELAAGLEFKTPNRWLELIEMSNQLSTNK